MRNVAPRAVTVKAPPSGPRWYSTATWRSSTAMVAVAFGSVVCDP